MHRVAAWQRRLRPASLRTSVHVFCPPACLQAESDAAENEVSHEESSCHYYTSLHSIEHVKLERVRADKQGQFSRTMPDGTTVSSAHTRALARSQAAPNPNHQP